MSDYRITQEQYDATLAKVVQANSRAARRGLAGRITIEGTPVTVTEKDEITGLDRTFEMVDVVLGGEPPRHNGWTFIATLDWDANAGLVVRTAPGVETVDRTNLVENFCDYCKTNRYRLETYLLRHDDGRQVQVGSTCIKDFLGIHVNVAWLDESSITSEFESFGFGDRGPRDHGTTYVLALAWALIKLDGYKSAKSYGATTKGDVFHILYPPKVIDTQYREWAGRVKELAVEAMDRAADVREFITSKEFVGDSEYVRNLKSIAAADMVSDRNIGILVSAPQAWAKHLERTLIRQAETTRPSNWVGAEKDKLVLVVTIKGVRFIESQYGVTTLYTMLDEDGNIFKWFSSKGAVLGDEVDVTVTIKATVKKHEEFRGVKSTMLLRVQEV